MFFESISPIVLAAVISSIISGVIVTFNNYRMTSVNNKFQLEREKKQHIWQEERENRRWYQEKTYDSYKKLIRALTNIIQLQTEIKDNEDVTKDEYSNFRNLYVEFRSEFTMIMINHPNKNSKEFKEKKVEIFNEALDLDKDPELALEMITQIMENDSRINIVNNPMVYKQFS
jgi:hypothetical protein